MADNATTNPRPDPLYKSSLSGHLLFWTILLVASCVWAGWDEFVTKRPYKSYQAAFVESYDRVLVNEMVDQGKREEAARASDEYKAFEKRIEEARTRNADVIAKLRAQSVLVSIQINAINNVVKFPKGEIGMLVNRIEHTGGSGAEGLKAQLEDVSKVRKFSVSMPQADGSKQELSDTFENLIAKTEALKTERTDLVRRTADLDAERAKVARELQHWLDMNLVGLTPDAIRGLRRELDSFEIGIKQIHVADIDLVDRCHTCHAGILSPVTVTREKLAKAGVEDEDMQTMFLSHPRPTALQGERDILEIHPPDKFGCSPCHNGNGTGTISTHLAHGLNKHWIWKLHDKENFEAGCQQCHEGSIHLDGADTLNMGRELFWDRACWACHKREGFNREAERLQEVATALQANRSTQITKLKERRDLKAIADDPEAPEKDFTAANARLDALTVEFSQIETEYDALRKQQRNLNFERKRQGPNLKEIRAKLKREWLVPWLADSRSFRPTTKMPQFRLNPDQQKAIAAYLWESAHDLEAPKQPAGNAEAGKLLFEQRGCMGCHGMREEYGEVGGVFAADLSRVGEKANYDYLVRWIYNPRERLLPYSPARKALTGDGDVTPDDFRKAGREAKWDRLHTECPTTGAEMIVENQTVMPELRLTLEEARNIASFLMTKKSDKQYGEAGFPEKPGAELVAYGEKLVKHFGCAGCHEIKGLEEEGPIGTELTKEGSKPLERLDYGLLTMGLKRGREDLDGDGVPGEKGERYDHKTFFMNKMRKPEIWDRGKDKSEFEALRMPDFGLADEENVALTTFMLGSVDSQFPDRFYYNPEGAQKDIEDGWWVVKKYNCQGCHQFLPGEKPRIQTLEWYQSENVALAPPSLVGQGFRTNAKWLAKFLNNPSLTEDEAKMNRNGVREYLKARMPTFHLTDSEIQKLVRFFAGLARQPIPQVDPPIDPLPPEGAAAAKAAFEKQVCLKCHITTGPLTPQVIAPSFTISGERLDHRWMKRWLINPQQLIPGSKMPSGLFVQRGGRWVFSGNPNDWPQELRDWKGDHVDLLVRYMRQYNMIHGQEGQ